MMRPKGVRESFNQESSIKEGDRGTRDLVDQQWEGGTLEKTDRSLFITFASLSSAMGY